ncbi:MAG: type II secretion system F family protein [Pseudomonas sp.]|uniref:type II secretion system F family protein n=1 Tax=Pseudomonas sp. TaxID=306 RepID=UPI003396969F
MSRRQPAPLSLDERAKLFTHLAALEKAGVSTEQSFALLKLPAHAQTRLQRMRQQLAQGMDVAAAGHKTGLLTGLEVALVGAAQSGGSPAVLYQRLADTYQVKARSAAAIRSRLRMPLIVLVLALLVQPLPRLVAGSLGFAGYLWNVLAPLMLLAGTVYLLRKGLVWLDSAGPSGRQRQVEAWLLAIPLLGPWRARQAARDFFETLGLLLEAGVAMFTALPKACAVLGHSPLSSTFARVDAAVQAGAPLSKALKSVDFPNKAQALGLIRAGEGSGALPAMLLRHAQGETLAVDDFQQQLAEWGPRALYGLLVAWMAFTLVSGGAFQPQVPVDL